MNAALDGSNCSDIVEAYWNDATANVYSIQS